MLCQLLLHLRGEEFYHVILSEQTVFALLLFLRHGGTRAYAVGTDLKPAEFPGRVLGKGDNAALGRRVDALTKLAQAPCIRTHVHDTSALLLDHCGKHGTNEVDDVTQVEVKVFLIFLHWDVQEGDKIVPAHIIY